MTETTSQIGSFANLLHDHGAGHDAGKGWLCLWSVLLTHVILLSSCGGKSDNGSANDAYGTGGTTNGRLQASGGRHVGATATDAGAAQSVGGTTLNVTAGGSTAQSSTSILSCDQASTPSCVENCFIDYPLIDNAICAGGKWSCGSGYILSTTCPESSCAVTQDSCCDPTTGNQIAQRCGTDGYRPACPTGMRPSGDWYCVPDALGVGDCATLDGQTCSEPAVHCVSMVGLGTSCSCFITSDAGVGMWQCAYYAGP